MMIKVFMALWGTRWKKTAVFLLAAGIIGCIHAAAFASSRTDAVKRLDPGGIKSFDQMKSAVSLLSEAAGAGRESPLPDFAAQNLILNKSGECISRLVFLYGKHSGKAGNLEKDARSVFLENRKVIKKILEANNAIIGNFQEKRLDAMDNPLDFLNSPEWQNTRHLISLSSYWLGWNGYYGSLVFSPDDPMKNTFLNEAVMGFSRASMDFSEEAVVARSLFGRALSYRELKSYAKAVQDLESVKKRIRREDSLYVKSWYEQIRIKHEMGDFKGALADLDVFSNEFSGEDIPGDIRSGLDALRAKATVAFFEKKFPADKSPGKSTDKAGEKALDPRLFEEMKRLAVNPNGALEFYRFVQSHAQHLDRRPLDELGPVAATALGDFFFDRKNFDRAQYYYLPFYEDFPSVLKNRMDAVWFRIAYIYCEQKNWKSAIAYLENFHRKFPKSPLGDEAAALYYAAALNDYRENSSEKTYNRFIDSARVYLKQCRGACPQRGDAHFQLGRHYEKTGQKDQAATEFAQVGEASPHYFPAQYYMLRQIVSKLESFRKSGEDKSEEAVKLYRQGAAILEKSSGRREGLSPAALKIQPHIVFLEASLLTYGPDDDCQKSLKIIRDFERRFPNQKNLFVKALRIRMTCYMRMKMPTEAREEFNRFVAAFPVNSTRYAELMNLANTFYRDAEKPHIEDPRDPMTAQYRGIALSIYEAICPFSCSNPEYQKYCVSTKIRMARIHEQDNRLKEAEILFLDALNQNPASADAVYGLGLIYEKMGAWDNALSTWREFSNGVAEGTHHWYESKLKMALALSKLGQKARACDILTTTLVLHPDFGSDELARQYQGLKSRVCETGPQK